MRLVALILLTANLSVLTCSAAADDPEVGSLNKQERLEWFRDQGFGLFIHWMEFVRIEGFGRISRIH